MKTRIKEYRARYNYTQDKLAKLIGVSRETILLMEKGRYNPSIRLAYNVSRVLHTTIDKLFIFEESDNMTKRI